MPAPKGHTKIGGRQKGTPNKIGLGVKEGVLNTFLELQKDPNYNLLEFAKKNLTDFYKIASKLIPTEMSVKAEITDIEIKKTILSKKGTSETSEPAVDV